MPVQIGFFPSALELAKVISFIKVKIIALSITIDRYPCYRQLAKYLKV